VDPEPFVGELQIGLVSALRLSDSCSMEFGYSQTFLTRHFKTQEEADSFGALTLSFLCRF
jgi:hypothetical protein